MAALALPFVGPIPGKYIIGKPRDIVKRGPHVLDLSPAGHNALGRTELLIHGDNIKNPGRASERCTIMPRTVNEKIAASNSNMLTVVKSNEKKSHKYRVSPSLCVARLRRPG